MASKLGRLAKLGGLTTRVSGSYLGQRMAGLFQNEEARNSAMGKLHIDNAERIVANLGALKGAAMKVGQAVAQIVDGIDLPGEAKEILGKLHDRAEPVPFDVVRARVESELGGDIDALFTRFDRAPLGTASLGQAHGARLPDGSEVVVKVLHPGVEDSVASDLSALKRMIVGARVLRRPKEELDAIFAEIEARLAEEIDYRLEAQNLTAFRRRFVGDDDVSIPRVHEGWSTGKVLCMERLQGKPLGVFVATGSREAKQRAGVTLGRTFLTMLYRDRAIHADPHPGNYLFTPDGKVGILDFGCVRYFDIGFVHDYGTCGYTTRHGDREGLMVAALKLGALMKRDPGAEDTLWELCRSIGIPFRDGPYTMGETTDNAHERIAAIMPRVMINPVLRAPSQLTFLHRGLGGTYQLARQLKARADWGDIFETQFLKCRQDLRGSTAAI